MLGLELDGVDLVLFDQVFTCIGISFSFEYVQHVIQVFFRFLWEAIDI